MKHHQVGGKGCIKFGLADWIGSFETCNILNKSENATLQLFIFYEKVLEKKYLQVNLAMSNLLAYLEYMAYVKVIIHS